MPLFLAREFSFYHAHILSVECLFAIVRKDSETTPAELASRRDLLKKHRNDLFRLLQLLRAERTIEVTEPLRVDLRSYIHMVAIAEGFSPRDFRVNIDRDEGFELLRSIYQL